MTKHNIVRCCLTLIALAMLNATTANAANNLAQCVQVTSSSVTASSLNPQYVVTVKDACDTDLGSVTIQFYSGSNDIRSATPQFRSIFKLSKWGDTLYFDLGNLAKGTYIPRLNVTVGKEPWAPQMFYLNSFQITGSSNGLESTPATPKQENISPREWCLSSNIIKKTCYPYPKWKYEICSYIPKGEVQEKRGSKWFTLWKVAGVKSDMCSNPGQFLLSTNGESKGIGTLSLRFWQPSTKSNGAWSDPIKIVLH